MSVATRRTRPVLLVMAVMFAALLARAQEPPQAPSSIEVLWDQLQHASEEDRGQLRTSLLEATEKRAEEVAADQNASKSQLMDCVHTHLRLLNLDKNGWELPLPDLLTRISASISRLETRLAPGLAALAQHDVADAAAAWRSFAVAEKILGMAIQKWPDVPALHILRADVSRERDDWSQVYAEIAVAEHAIGLRPESPEVTEDRQQLGLVRAQVDCRIGRPDRAVLFLKRLLDEPAVPPEIRGPALNVLADVYLRLEQPRRVLDLDRRSAVVGGERPGFAVQVALARTSMALSGEASLEEARDALNTAIKSPEVTELGQCIGSIRLAELLLAMHDFVGAEGLLRSSGEQLHRWAVEDSDQEAVREEPYHCAVRMRAMRARGASDEELRGGEERVLAALDTMLKSWRTTPIAPGGLGFLGAWDRRAVLHEAIEISLARQGKERALDHLLAAQAQGTLARTLGLGPPTLDSVRRALLAEGEILLIYLPTANRTHLFAVSASGLDYYPLDPKPVLRRAIMEFDRHLQERHDEADLRARAENVRDLVLPKTLRDKLAQATILRISGAELLQDLCFELLPSIDGRPLGLSVPIVYVPSVPVAVFLRERATARVLPANELPLALLIGARRSLDGTSEFTVDAKVLVSPFGTRAIVTDFAEPSALANFVLPHCSILTFVGHGVIDRTRNWFAGLFLGTGSEGRPRVLWADELQQQGTFPPVVILAACRSGEGPDLAGEDGASHLGGVALLHGADTVAIGRGDLPAAPTIDLVRTLHAELAHGLTPAAALLAARRSQCPDGTLYQLARCAHLQLFGLGDVAPIAGLAATSHSSSQKK